MVDETYLREVVAILKQLEEELDGVVERKIQAAGASARLDERCATPEQYVAGRNRLAEIKGDLVGLSGTFDSVSRARKRLERFHDWLMTEPSQTPLSFAKAVA
jgi:hypothetical protein